MKSGFVYILTNSLRTTLYIGVTSNICRRMYEHKSHSSKKSFSNRYNLDYCVYYEEHTDIASAIKRETQLKSWSRRKKVDLIERLNPEWKELVTSARHSERNAVE